MTTIDLRNAIEHQVKDVQRGIDNPGDTSRSGLIALHALVGPWVESTKGALLTTPLQWTDEEKADAGWIHSISHRIAALGLRLTESLGRSLEGDDPRLSSAISLTLLYMGEAMKWEISSGTQVPRDFKGLHALMRRGISTGRQREPIRLQAGGRERSCTLESLYFRALLLARFASGALSCKQIEILDEWLWMWAAVLEGVSEPPPGSALRADLDSGDGLRRGPRRNAGVSLYLPQGPIEAAFRTLLTQFHAGRIVPAEGCTAGFRIEEHVAVLDIIRRGLRAARLEPLERAPRLAAGTTVDLHIGLGEITAKGFTSAVPRVAPSELTGKVGAQRSHGRIERDRDLALDAIYDPTRRRVTLANQSASGLGLEGSEADCGALAVGDLVGVRISPLEPVVIGKVMRCIPASTPGRVIVGVRRLSADVRPLDVTTSGSRGANTSTMLYVPGDDPSGNQDAYLVGERTFAEGGALEVPGVDNLYRFRFNRIRGRGRGWVLAGFEIMAARPRSLEATVR